MNKKIAYLLLLPSLFAFLLTSAWPVVQVGYLSFFKTNYITSTFVGFKNFITTFSALGRVLLNSSLYALGSVAGRLLLALGTALFIINMHKRVHDVMRFVFYVPTFAAGVIISMTWRWIFHPQAGLANWLLSLLGLESVIWMGDRFIAIGAISFILVTSYSGMALVIYLAAMLSIKQSVFESARMDGASWFQIKMRIILPMILPTVGLLTLLDLIAGFQIWETVYFMSPIQNAHNLMLDIFRTGFVYSRYGLAAAKSLVLMSIILVLSLVKRRLEHAN